MNINRLLHIAQQADIEGDYVTADRVTNLLKTAQGQYSVMPSNTTQQPNAQQQPNNQQQPNAQQQPSSQLNRQVSPQEYANILYQYKQQIYINNQKFYQLRNAIKIGRAHV